MITYSYQNVFLFLPGYEPTYCDISNESKWLVFLDCVRDGFIRKYDKWSYCCSKCSECNYKIRLLTGFLESYNLLTARLVMILGNRPTWLTFLFYISISILHMFRATSCSSSGVSIVSIQPPVHVTLCRWPFRVQIGKFLSDLHTKQSPTPSDMYQICIDTIYTPDDEHKVVRNMWRIEIDT